MWLKLSLLIMSLGVITHGACQDLEILTEYDDKLCRNSPVYVASNDDNAMRYYWDFCPEQFSEQPSTTAFELAGLGQIYGYQLIEENGKWYGFAVSRSLNKLFRLDFGENPLAKPAIHDLGNPGALMDAPEGITMYKDGGSWFAFVGKGENARGQVVKFAFGADITHTPAATGYGTFDSGSVRIRDLSIVMRDDEFVLLLLIYNSASIKRVSFGNTLANDPVPGSSVSALGNPLPRGFSVVAAGEHIKAHIVYENGTVQQVSFGSDIDGAVVTEGSFTFPSVISPWKIRTVASAGKYFAVISNHNRKYTVLNFGDLSLSVTPLEVSHDQDVRFIGFDIARHEGLTFVQGGGTGSALICSSYRNLCGAIPEHSDERHPPAVRYSEHGMLSVDLVASSDAMNQRYAFQTISIKDKDVFDVTISIDGACLDAEVSISAVTADEVLSWNWTLDNDVVDVSANPVIVYDQPGIYDIGLRAITAQECLIGSHQQFEVYPPPASSFTLPGAPLCTNSSLPFITTTPDIYDGHLAYEWLVDGVPAGTQRDLEHAFTQKGEHDITLRTSIPGCSDELTLTTPPIYAGPAVDFSYSGACEKDLYAFTNEIDEPVLTYDWDFGNGTTSQDPDPEMVYDTYGEYDVTLTVTNNVGCENKATQSLIVRSLPLVDFSVDGPPNACTHVPVAFRNMTMNPDGQPINEWNWVFDDNDPTPTSTLDAPTHTFDASGTYQVSLTARTKEGCSVTRQHSVEIYPTPNPQFSHTPACYDRPVEFTGDATEAIADWYWEIGTAYYVTPSPQHIFRAPGTYDVYLQVTGANGCEFSRTEPITVPEPLAPDFTAIQNCVGYEAILTNITTGNDPVRLTTWSVGGVTVGTQEELRYVFAETGEELVKLEVISEAGCTYSVAKPIGVLPPPVADFSADFNTGAYPLEVSFTNTSEGANDFHWTFGNGQTSTAVSPEITYTTDGTFEVELVATDQVQCRAVARELITVVTPLPDVAIDVINIVDNPDGSKRVVATIHNRGNSILRALPVDLEFAGGLRLRETIDDRILPGEKYNFVLSSVSPAGAGHYACFALDLENDLQPDDNRQCITFGTTMMVLTGWPNPAAAELNVDCISDRQRPARFTLMRADGSVVLSSPTTLNPGLNRRSISLSGVSEGLYLLVVESSGVRSTQRVVVAR